MSDEENLFPVSVNTDVNDRRRLNWLDLIIIITGIILIYVVLGLLTFWVSGWWPHEHALLYLNGFGTQFSFILLIGSFIKLRGWTLADLGWKPVKMRKVWSRIISLYAFTWLINLVYALVVYQFGITPPQTDVYSELLSNITPLTLFLNILLAGVLAPMVEETLFRGIIFSSLRSYFGLWTAAVISAVLFSGLHMQAIGFIPRFALGIILAYLYSGNRSLYPSMVFHSLNNVVATILMAGIS